jgi:uncharacterized protein
LLRGTIFANPDSKNVNRNIMNCPVCNDSKLVMSERQGIEIDYCPRCRGVWLDRGELDKIIERSFDNEEPRVRSEERFKGDSSYYKRGYTKKRESFLGDLFDF